jgi:hypothetical protein
MRFSVRVSLLPAWLLLLLLIPVSRLSGEATNATIVLQGKMFYTCGTVDELQVAIRLAERKTSCRAKQPYPSIEIRLRAPLTVPRTIAIQEEPNSDIYVSRCPHSTAQCETPVSGSIALERSTPSGLTGHYEFTFKNGQTSSGTFQAQWCHQRGLGCP